MFNFIILSHSELDSESERHQVLVIRKRTVYLNMYVKSISFIFFLFLVISACKKTPSPQPLDNEPSTESPISIDTIYTELGGFGPFNTGSYWTRRHQWYSVDDQTGVITTIQDDTLVTTMVCEVFIDSILYMMRDDGNYYHTKDGIYTVGNFDTDSLFHRQIYLNTNLDIGDTIRVNTFLYDGTYINQRVNVVLYDYYGISDSLSMTHTARTRSYNFYDGGTSGVSSAVITYKEGIGETYWDSGAPFFSANYRSLIDYFIEE